MSELPYEVEVRYVCDLCWESFDSPVELLLHEAAEDDQLYTIDGVYESSTSADTQ